MISVFHQVNALINIITLMAQYTLQTKIGFYQFIFGQVLFLCLGLMFGNMPIIYNIRMYAPTTLMPYGTS